MGRKYDARAKLTPDELAAWNAKQIEVMRRLGKPVPGVELTRAAIVTADLDALAAFVQAAD